MFIEEILEATGGRLLCGDIKTEVLTTSTNSREIGEKCLFVPVIGENVDAHKFIDSAFANGAVASFTSEHDTAKGNNVVTGNLELTFNELLSLYGRNSK